MNDENSNETRFCDRLILGIFTLALAVLVLSLIHALTSVPYN